MEIQNLTNLPSDPDITVILVKKSLNQCQDSKSGDGKNLSANTSLVNFVAHKQEGTDDKSSTLTPVSSWDVADTKAVDNCGVRIRTHVYSSNKKEGLFRVSESPRASHSDVALNTIQKSYAESEPEEHPDRICDKFEDVDLADSSVVIAEDKNANRQTVKEEPEMRRKSKTLLSACFPCMAKDVNDEDD